ncbi:BON domain-containing protein [Chitinophaga sp.]|uniref:BON domain-containing protein n=1 Tax=Chitinophaga sp. TaxID=1869181 RepID=UPI0031DA9495
MKHSKTLLLSVAVATSVTLFSCKGNNTNNNADTTTTTVAPEAPDTNTTPPPPVEAAVDDSLTTKANDAVKDYPGVTASVSNGEVTLTGEISKAKLPKLLQAVNATNPKKVNNQLTVK